MVKKQFEINEVATFAWDQNHPILATGTLSGALDDSFSSTSILKLYNHNSKILGQVDSKTRFTKLAWSGNGVIAGGLEDGTLSFWQSEAIINKSENPLLLNSSIHTGPINSLEIKGHLLASASNEVYIWDLNKQDPFFVTKLPVNNLSWNNQVQHIMAMGLNNQIVIWDIRNKKEVKTISIQTPTSVVWHPDQTTQLVTSSDNGAITLWDLRHTQVPEKIMTGHTDGILDLSWCRQDPDLLLSCGKDGKTNIWNPNSGEALGEVAQQLNWTFKTSWSPCQPDLFASASYEGKIQVYSLQQTESAAEDPFSAALKIPKTLTRPPKWFRRPIGATFAFGGKLILFNSSRKVKCVTVVTENNVIQRATEFEKALTEKQDSLLDKYEEKNDDDWKVLRALLVQENIREHLIAYLGFDKAANEILGNVEPLLLELKETKDLNQVKPIASNNSDFFTQVIEENNEKRQLQLNLYSQDKSDINSLISRTVVLGDFESAVRLCLHHNRVSDALMFAIYGGKELLEKTQQAYFQRAKTDIPYVSLLKSLMTNDFEHLVNSVSLNDWRTTLVSLCTYAIPEEFSSLCNMLGQRLEAASMLKESLICYMSSKNVEKVCRIWVSDFKCNTAMDLQRIVEKITTFVKIIGFKDKNLVEETKENSSLHSLSPLYELYYEYAYFLTSQGKLSSSLYYLNQIPHGYDSNRLALLRDRVYCTLSLNTTSNRQIQPPKTPYEIKAIISSHIPATSPLPSNNYTNTAYSPVNTSPLVSNRYRTAYVPPTSSPLVSNNNKTATNYTYSENKFSPRPNRSQIPSNNAYSPIVNHTQVTNTYNAASNYSQSNIAHTSPNNNYSTNANMSPQTNSYPQQPSNYPTYSSNNTSYSPKTTATTSNYSSLANTYTTNTIYNSYPAVSDNYSQSQASLTKPVQYNRPYSPKIPTPPPVTYSSPFTATETTTPRPTAFHDPPPMLINKTPKRNTTPVKRVMSPFASQQNVSYQTNYSPSIGSPRPNNVLPPPPMNASAPAPLSRQKTPTYNYYQQSQRMN